MRISGPRHVAVATVGLGLFVGCATYNTLYNAEALYREAEDLRLGLAARRLSAALFQAYADAAPDGLWYTKALLAARELTTDPAERERVDERVDEELIARRQFAGAPRE